MTARLDLERLVTSWLEDDAPPHAPSGMLRTILAEVAAQRQERHVTQRIFGDELGRSARLRWALVVVAIASGLVGATVVGSWMYERAPAPTTSWHGSIAFAADFRAGDHLEIAVARGGTQVRDIYIVHDGMDPRRIIRGDELEQACPAFSPNGRTLAYVEADVGPQVGGPGGAARPASEVWSLVLKDLDDIGSPIASTERRIPLPPTAPIEAPCFKWSPDGRSLGRARAAWDGGPGGVEIVTVADARVRFLRLERTEATATAFDWAPDSAQFAVYAAGGGMDVLLLVPVEQEWAVPGLIVRDLPVGSDRVTWSSAGQYIAVSATPSGPSESSVIEMIDTGDLQGPRASIEGAAPTWDRDGRYLAMLGADWSEIVGAGTRDSIPLEIAAQAPWLVWSPDGTRLLYAGAGSDGTVALISVLIEPHPTLDWATPMTRALASATGGDVSWTEVLP